MQPKNIGLRILAFFEMGVHFGILKISHVRYEVRKNSARASPLSYHLSNPHLSMSPQNFCRRGVQTFETPQVHSTYRIVSNISPGAYIFSTCPKGGGLYWRGAYIYSTTQTKLTHNKITSQISHICLKFHQKHFTLPLFLH